MLAQIELTGLLIGFIPVVFVLYLMWRTNQDIKNSLISILRMLIQLLLVGYALVFVFDAPSPAITMSILILMLLTASYIALNVSQKSKFLLFKYALLAMLLGGGSVLIVIAFGVLNIESWYNPRVLLPLAGMIFASSMTAISLSLERFESEMLSQNKQQSINKAFKAAMIPVVNSMLAVGVVSLPGMMTGQILSGVEPYIAARYQIMVMCMIFSSTGLTIFIFLNFLSKEEL